MNPIAGRRHRSVRELAWRSRAQARVIVDRVRMAVRRPRWRRDTITRIVTPALAADLAHPVRRRDWPAVDAALAAHLGGRPSRFVLDPTSRADLRAGILARWPEAAGDAARLGDRLIDGRYDLLAFEGLAFGPPGAMPDWHFDPVHDRRAPMRFWADVPYLDPSCGDHKIIWELNRHQHWLRLGRASWLTGDPRYRRAILGQLRHWLDANPPLLGINWASMLEIGFRCLSWIWALHLLLDAPHDEDGPWLVDLLVALDRQLTHVERNLSWYFSPNTHLTGEALALYVAGCALPELAASRRWASTGRTVLLAEIHRQIEADGGHVERSTHYHRYTLDFYLLALLVARGTGDTAATTFAEATARLADAMRTFADDEGRIPLIGDDDGGMLCPWRSPQPADVRASVALAALVLQRPDLSPWPPSEEACWMAWPAMAAGLTLPPAAAAIGGDGRHTLHTRILPDTGYAVVRDGAGGHLVFDVGPHGYLNGGHAHADALALTLTIGRRPLLVDPGTATYTMDPALRDRMRRSSSHNTVTLDRASTSEPAGPFHWRTRADARLAVVRDNPGFVWVEGVCDAGPRGAARHRRSLIATSGGWLVADRIEGTGRHRADAHWHFAPAWAMARAGERALLAEQDGTRAWILHDTGTTDLVRGQGSSDIGWYSPGYGRLEPTWSARTSLEGDLPLALVTWVSQAPANGPMPIVERLTADGDGVVPCVAVRVIAGDVESWVLLRPGDVAARATRTCTMRAYRTDGRLLAVERRGGRVRTLALADGTAAVALEAGGVSVQLGDRIDDLCLRLDDRSLDVLASTPPAQLELRGATLADVTEARVNGRAVPIRRSRDGTLLVESAEAGAEAPAVTGSSACAVPHTPSS